MSLCLTLCAVEREVLIYNDTDSAVLSGTLAVPELLQPRAAIVLASGSGAHDRDETVYNAKPFKVISDSLVTEGYAVLRYDDRGVGGSTGRTADATTKTFAADIACCIDSLHRWFPNTQVGVLGHSEGGIKAIMNAAHNDACDFIITIGAPGMRGDSLLMAQSRAIAVAATGRYDAENLQRQLIAIAASEMPTPQARIMMTSVLASELPDQMKIPALAQQLRNGAEGLLIPWYRFFLRYDPTADVMMINKPWLAINGVLDLQVPCESLEMFAANCKSVTTEAIENHNHLLQECHTGLPAEYASCGQSPSDKSLQIIKNWLNSRF